MRVLKRTDTLSTNAERNPDTLAFLKRAFSPIQASQELLSLLI